MPLRSVTSRTTPRRRVARARRQPGAAPGAAPTSLVVGASSGIGRATALALAARGDHVGLLARRAEELEEVAAQCRDAGAASAWVSVCDVDDDAQVARAVADARARRGRIDVVVHCAGIVTYGRTDQADPEDVRRVVETNLLGTMTVARHVVPVMREQRYGALVVVGSLLGHISVPGMTPYVVSKWGVRALVRQLRIENRDVRGLRIVHVAPGSVDTDIYGDALDDAGAVNAPPPPTIQPERVAEVVLRALDRRRGGIQTSLLNYALIGAHATVPQAWDRLVGPVFRAVSHRPADSSTGRATRSRR